MKVLEIKLKLGYVFKPVFDSTNESFDKIDKFQNVLETITI